MTDLPIEHLSYSSLRLLCSNPWQFKKNYILSLWDYKRSPTATAGVAVHKVLELFYSGADLQMALQKGQEYIDSLRDEDIEWGKTGTREGIVKDMHNAVNFYMSEQPEIGEVVATEKTVVTDIVYEGKRFPLPIKVKTDLLTRKDGKLVMIDYKVVTTFSDKEVEKPDYIMQAMFNYWSIKMSMKEAPHSMIYVEIKKTQNRNGDPQVQLYEIVFDQHPEYQVYFFNMYAGAIKFLSNPEVQFLPNFSDMFNAKETWADFTAEIMDFNLPEQVSHKSTTVSSVDRKQFVDTFTESEVSHSPEGKITAKLQEFGLAVKHVETHSGATVELYSFKPSRGVRMSAVLKHDRDLQLALEAESVRVIAPIPGTSYIGVEVAKRERDRIDWSKDLVQKGTLNIPVGVDVYGKTHTLDLAKAPHLLVAGATGAGKSVAMNVFISTLVEQNNVNELGLVLIDPKRSEFFDFEDVSHLLTQVITENEDARSALDWACLEMEERYKLLQKARAKNIDEYNAQGNNMKKIVIVIDELADLLLSGDIKTEIEASIIRLAQKARASGIHLIVATQRPSVDVVTGLLKANFPTRIAFMTSTKTDSQVILDQPGAEKLVGNGDSLLMNPREKGLVRLQGLYK